MEVVFKTPAVAAGKDPHLVREGKVLSMSTKDGCIVEMHVLCDCCGETFAVNKNNTLRHLPEFTIFFD